MKTILYLSVFDVVTKQIVLLDTFLITNKVKWVSLHCTNAVSHANLKYKIKSSSRLPITDFSSYHCRKSDQREKIPEKGERFFFCTVITRKLSKSIF